MPQRIQQSSSVLIVPRWLTTVGTALYLCHSSLLGPASQLIAGVAGTMTNLHNYDNKGVDRNSSLMLGDYGGGKFTFKRCMVGEFLTHRRSV